MMIKWHWTVFVAAGTLLLLDVALAQRVPAPSGPSGVTAKSGGDGDKKTGTLIVEWSPARSGNETMSKYHYTVKPGFCKFTDPREGNIPTVNISGPPYRILLVCNCGYVFTPYVATAGVVAGQSPSAFVKGTPSKACEKN
jgi:hypothetical protein